MTDEPSFADTITRDRTIKQAVAERLESDRRDWARRDEDREAAARAQWRERKRDRREQIRFWILAVCLIVSLLRGDGNLIDLLSAFNG